MGSCTACARGAESLLQLEETTGDGGTNGFPETAETPGEKEGGGGRPFPREKQSAGATGLCGSGPASRYRERIPGVRVKDEERGEPFGLGSCAPPLPPLASGLTGSSGCTQKQTFFFGSRLARLPADNRVGYKTIIESYNNLYNIAIYFIVKINYYAFPYR